MVDMFCPSFKFVIIYRLFLHTKHFNHIKLSKLLSFPVKRSATLQRAAGTLNRLLMKSRPSLDFFSLFLNIITVRADLLNAFVPSRFRLEDFAVFRVILWSCEAMLPIGRFG